MDTLILCFCSHQTVAVQGVQHTWRASIVHANKAFKMIAHAFYVSDVGHAVNPRLMEDSAPIAHPTRLDVCTDCCTVADVRRLHGHTHERRVDWRGHPAVRMLCGKHARHTRTYILQYL